MIASGQHEKFWSNVEADHSVSLSVEIKDLLSGMFMFNPVDRPSIEEVINHPWIKKKASSKHKVKKELEARKGNRPSGIPDSRE